MEYDKMKIKEIINWERRGDEEDWYNKLVLALAPLINKKVLLSGGGSWDTNICTLKEINKIEYPDGSVNIDVKLQDIEPALFGKHEFEPHLGMWRISEIVKDAQDSSNY